MGRIALGFVAIASTNDQLVGDTQACIVVQWQGAIGTQQFIAMCATKIGVVTAITLLPVPKPAPAIGHTRFRLGVLLERLGTLARLFLRYPGLLTLLEKVCKTLTKHTNQIANVLSAFLKSAPWAEYTSCRDTRCLGRGQSG